MRIAFMDVTFVEERSFFGDYIYKEEGLRDRGEAWVEYKVIYLLPDNALTPYNYGHNQ